MKRQFTLFLLSLMLIGSLGLVPGIQSSIAGALESDSSVDQHLEFPTIHEESPFTIATDGDQSSDSIASFSETLPDDTLFYPDVFLNDTPVHPSAGSTNASYTKNDYTYLDTYNPPNDDWETGEYADPSPIWHYTYFNFTAPSNAEGFVLNVYTAGSGFNPPTNRDIEVYDGSTWNDVGDTSWSWAWTNVSVIWGSIVDSKVMARLYIKPALGVSYANHFEYAEVQFYVMTLADSNHYAESFADISDWTSGSSDWGTDGDVVHYDNGAGAWNRIMSDTPSFASAENLYYEMRVKTNHTGLVRFLIYSSDGNGGTETEVYGVVTTDTNWHTRKGIITVSHAIESIRLQSFKSDAPIRTYYDCFRIGPADEMGWQHDGSTTAGIEEEGRSGWSYTVSSDDDKLTLTYSRSGGSSSYGSIYINFDTTSTEIDLESDYYPFMGLNWEVTSLTGNNAYAIPYIDGLESADATEYFGGQKFDSTFSQTTHRLNIKALGQSIATKEPTVIETTAWSKVWNWRGLAFDGTYYYVGDINDKQVHMYQASDGTLIRSFSDGSLTYLGHGVAVSDTHVWSSDYSVNERVYQYLIADGSYVTNWTLPVEVTGDPLRLDYDGTNLWILTTTVGKVWCVDTSGNYVSDIDVSSFDSNSNLALDEDGNILIFDKSDSKIYKYSQAGVLLGEGNFADMVYWGAATNISDREDYFYQVVPGAVEYIRKFQLPNPLGSESGVRFIIEGDDGEGGTIGVNWSKADSIANFTVTQDASCTTADIVYVDANSDIVFDRDTSNYITLNHDPALSTATATYNVANLTISGLTSLGGAYDWGFREFVDAANTWTFDETRWEMLSGTLTDFHFNSQASFTLSAIEFWEDATAPDVLSSQVSPSSPDNLDTVTIGVLVSDWTSVYRIWVNPLSYPSGFSDQDYELSEVQDDFWTYSFSNLAIGYYAFEVLAFDAAQNSSYRTDPEALVAFTVAQDYRLTRVRVRSNLLGVDQYIPFEAFDVYLNDSLLLDNLFEADTSAAHKITVKDRWGETLNETVFSWASDLVVYVNVYSLKVVSWASDFTFFNLTHSGTTFTTVLMPGGTETLEFLLYAGSYSYLVDYRNGTSISGSLTLNNSTAIVVTGNSISDLAGMSTNLLAMTTEINVTVTSTNNQVLTISIDLTNTNSTIYNQTIQILSNIVNSNSTIYDQTVSLMSAISNVNSTLYAQTVQILSDLQNINTTLYAQTVSLLSSIQNVNTTIYSQTLTILTNLANINTTIYSQGVDVLTYIQNTNSTLYAQTVSILAEVDEVEELADFIFAESQNIKQNVAASGGSRKPFIEWDTALLILLVFTVLVILVIAIRATRNDKRQGKIAQGAGEDTEIRYLEDGTK